MKHSWTPLLWELWAVQAVCAGAAMLPGSRFCTYPGLLVPGLMLSAAVPAAWAIWGVCGARPEPPAPEQPLEPLHPYDLMPLIEDGESGR